MKTPENITNPDISESPDFEGVEKVPEMDFLLVAGAVMDPDAEKPEKAFPSVISPRYTGAIVMGKARAMAAVELASKADTLLVTGGTDVAKTGEKKSRSEALSNLISNMGVPEEKVIPMGKGGNTQANIQDLAAYLEAHPDILKRNRFGILCLTYQYKRMRRIFEVECAKKPFFQNHQIEVEWFAVEKVLEKRDPHFKRWADAVDKAPAVDSTTGKADTAGNIARRMEKKGLDDYEKSLMGEGEYKPITK